MKWPTTEKDRECLRCKKFFECKNVEAKKEGCLNFEEIKREKNGKSNKQA